MEYISCKIFSEGMYIIILFEGPDLSQLDGPIAPNWASLLKDPTLDVERTSWDWDANIMFLIIRAALAGEESNAVLCKLAEYSYFVVCT
jgi:hypothetical protein